MPQKLVFAIWGLCWYNLLFHCFQCMLRLQIRRRGRSEHTLVVVHMFHAFPYHDFSGSDYDPCVIRTQFWWSFFSLCGTFWPNNLLHCGWILDQFPFSFHVLPALNIQYDLDSFTRDIHTMYLDILIQRYQARFHNKYLSHPLSPFSNVFLVVFPFPLPTRTPIPLLLLLLLMPPNVFLYI